MSLTQWHKQVTLVRLEPVDPGSRVKHWATALPSLVPEPGKLQEECANEIVSGKIAAQSETIFSLLQIIC